MLSSVKFLKIHVIPCLPFLMIRVSTWVSKIVRHLADVFDQRFGSQSSYKHAVLLMQWPKAAEIESLLIGNRRDVATCPDVLQRSS